MASPYSAGGLPDRTDVVVGSVFIAVFGIAGVTLHLRSYHRYGFRFIWSLLCFTFCAARCLAIGFRISLSHHLTNKPLACICQILISAGIAILFVVNLQLSRRFICQLHPRFSAPANYILSNICLLVDPILTIVIIAIIQTYATSDPHILSVDRKIRIFASVFFVMTAFLPIAIVSLALALKVVPRPTLTPQLEKGAAKIPSPSPVDLARAISADATIVEDRSEPKTNESAETRWTTFFAHVPATGYGPVPTTSQEIAKNAASIVIPAVLLTIEQSIRAAQVYYRPKPGVHLPWYMSKASFWTCIFGLEVIVIIFLGLVSLPKRFSNLQRA